jgi:Tol biopolymer transport system component
MTLPLRPWTGARRAGAGQCGIYREEITMRKIFLFVSIGLLISGMVSCQPVAPTITPTATALLPTQTPLPTFIPTDTPILTPSPYPTLSPTGPYLLYDTTVWGEGHLTMLDILGGHRSLVLPEDNYISNLQKSVSPDGKWLAFYIGPHKDQSLTYEKLTLNLLYIPDGSIHYVTEVITNYPKNLPTIAALLSQEDPKNYPTETNWTREIGEYFRYGITALSWSPDGQYLAFAAQIDGPSSDIYIYDVSSMEIRRLTADDTRNIWFIDWSPGGGGIMFTNSIPGAGYPEISLHFITPSNKPEKNPEYLASISGQRGYGWLSSNEYLFSYIHGEGTDFISGLKKINIETGEGIFLWKGEFIDGIAIDRIHDQIALSAEDGIYLVSFDGTYRKISDRKYIWFLNYRVGTKFRFIGFEDITKRIVQVDTSGTILALFSLYDWDDQGSHKISISPDHRWLVSSDRNRLELYSEADELVFKSSDFPTWDKAIWRSDSKGFYVEVYTTHSMLYYISVPDGKSSLVDECLSDECILHTENSVWLP